MNPCSLRCRKTFILPGKAAVSRRLAVVMLLRLRCARALLRYAATTRGEYRLSGIPWLSAERRGAGKTWGSVRMNRVRTRPSLLLMLVYCTFGTASAAEWHPAGRSCGSCHLSAAPNQSDAGQLVADEAALCRDCHRNAVQASHPIGVAPGFTIPAGLPLSARGEITCSTCHQVHGQAQAKLRPGRDGQGLCESCHEPGFFSGMKDGGTSLLALGHLDAGAPFTGNVDNFSIQCMACHEDAGDMTHRQAAGLDSGVASAKANHPIGRRYADSIRFGDYRPLHRLPATILLPDGKVSCLSCHQGYSERHGGLVVENNQDQLCFTCHDL